MFDIKEFIFDGVSESPDVPDQGMDMHSFNDGVSIWYPYTDYNGGGAKLQKVIKYDIATDTLEEIALDVPPSGNHQVYQAIPSSNPSTPDIIWFYSAYGNRALWKYDKSDDSSEYIDLGVSTSFLFGGKISSMMIDGFEHIIATIVVVGEVVAYRDTPAQDIIKELDLGAITYGIQNDGVNFFYVQSVDGDLKAFTMTDAQDETINATIATQGAVDIAYDGTHIWASCKDVSGDTLLIEQFEPVYTGEIVTSFSLIDTHQTGSPTIANPVSIKANDRYVVACYESGSNDPPTLGWDILNRRTGIWFTFWDMVTQQVYPEAVTPYTKQYWETVTAEIVAPDAIYMTGYSPALQGGVMNSTNCPNGSMRLLKFTLFENGLNDALITGATLSSI
jgi:hypothetical protein